MKQILTIELGVEGMQQAIEIQAALLAFLKASIQMRAETASTTEQAKALALTLNSGQAQLINTSIKRAK